MGSSEYFLFPPPPGAGPKEENAHSAARTAMRLSPPSSPEKVTRSPGKIKVATLLFLFFSPRILSEGILEIKRLKLSTLQAHMGFFLPLRRKCRPHSSSQERFFTSDSGAQDSPFPLQIEEKGFSFFSPSLH